MDNTHRRMDRQKDVITALNITLKVRTKSLETYDYFLLHFRRHSLWN